VFLVRGGQALRWRRRRLHLLPDKFAGTFAAGTATAGGPEAAFGRLLLSWEELSEDLGCTGLRRGPSETPAEFACRAAETMRLDGTLTNNEQKALVEIGEAFSRAAYSDWRPPSSELNPLLESAHAIGRRARTSLPWRGRVLHCLDPRTTWRPVLSSPRPG